MSTGAFWHSESERSPVHGRAKAAGEAGPAPHILPSPGFAHLLALIYTSHSLSKRLSSSGAAIFHAKRTFQPNRRHRSKTHGFRTRMKPKAGRAVISRRRAKGRKRVSVKPGFRE